MILNKFNNLKDLESAYVELQKAFTKKCQELSCVKEQLNEATTSNNLNNNNIQNLNDNTTGNDDFNNEINLNNSCNNVDDKTTATIVSLTSCLDKTQAVSDDCKSDINLDENCNNTSVDENCKQTTNEVNKFSSYKFKKQVKEFLQNVPDSKKYANSMSKILLTDSAIAGLDNAVEVAYALAKSKSFTNDVAINKATNNDNLTDKQVDVNKNNAYLDQNQSNLSQNQLNLSQNYSNEHGNTNEQPSIMETSTEGSIASYFDYILKRKNTSPSFVAGGFLTPVGASPNNIKSLSDAGNYILKNYFK